MPTFFACSCGEVFWVEDNNAEQKNRCPFCGEFLSAPQASEEIVPVKDLSLKDAPTEHPQPQPNDEEERSSFGEEELPEVLSLEDVPPVQPQPQPKDDERSSSIKIKPPAYPVQERGSRRRGQHSERLEEWEARRVERPKRRKRRERRESPPLVAFEKGWFGSTNAGVSGGLIMIVFAFVCMGITLPMGVLFFIGPIMLVIGLVAVIKGLLNG